MRTIGEIEGNIIAGLGALSPVVTPGEVHTWAVVSPGEADAASGRLSTESPIAQALLGRVAGETVTAKTPRGPRRYTVMELVP